MRIVGGTYKGLRVGMPKAGTIRPTTDRSREALFNILSHRFDIEGTRVLDLFGGSGIISMEFASRGAEEVICVEKNRKVALSIITELDRLGIEGVKVKTADALRFIRNSTDSYDFIFADPPYHLPVVAGLPDLIMKSKLLKSSGIFILEHESNVQPSDHMLLERRAYGQSVFSIYSQGE